MYQETHKEWFHLPGRVSDCRLRAVLGLAHIGRPDRASALLDSALRVELDNSKPVDIPM